MNFWRSPSFETEQSLLRLYPLHQLTLSWMKEWEKSSWFSLEKIPTHLLNQAWVFALFSSSANRETEELLFQENISLQKTEELIQEFQIYALKAFLESPLSQQKIQTLESISYQEGKKYGEKRKPVHHFQKLLFLLQRTFFSSYPQPGILVQRCTTKELRFSLSRCPHHHERTHAFSPLLQETLCQLQFYWIKGLETVFDTENHVQKIAQDPHCTYLWSFQSSQTEARIHDSLLGFG